MTDAGAGPDEEGRIDRCNVDIGMLLRKVPESLLGQDFGYDMMEHIIGGLRVSEFSGGGNPILF